MKETEAMNEIAQQLGLTLNNTKDEGLKLLVATINDLLNRDFQKLISILYRVDVNEGKLRSLLQQQPDTDAGLIIANMLIDRQLQKIKSREESKRNNKNMSDEEKW